MLNAIIISHVFVADQNKALDFYVGKLGLEVSNDQDLGFMRWLTVRVPGQPGRDILLSRGRARRQSTMPPPGKSESWLRKAHLGSPSGSPRTTVEKPIRSCSPKASSSPRSRSSGPMASMLASAIPLGTTSASCNSNQRRK